MKPLKFIILYFLLFVACTSKQSNKVQSHTSSKKDIKSNIKNTPTPKYYIFENDTLKQVLELKVYQEHEIAFKLISLNKKRKQQAKIEGIAKSKSGDIEIEEDTEGNAYPVNEYIYEKNCWLAIRIDRSTKTKIRINEAECNIHNLYCPFSSIDLLVIKD